jgi:hypothetical protein
MLNNYLAKIKAVIILLLAIIVGAELYSPLVRVFFKVPVNYNDGWNAYHVAQAIAGQPLYQNILTPITYPPFSFYILAFFVKIFGNPLITERLVSIFSILAIGICVFYLVRLFTKSFFESIFAALFCLELFTSFANSYVGMADFQLLGNALMLFALIIYFKFSSVKSLFTVSLLISISLFINPDLIAIPIALVMYSFFYQKRQFLPLICFLILEIFAFTVVSQIISNNHFIYWTLFVRLYFLSHAFYLSFAVFTMLFMPIIFSFIFSFISLKENKYHFFILYFVTSLALGVIFSGGGGININVFFDLFISVSLAIGLFIHKLNPYLKNSPKKRVIYLYILTILILFPLIFNVSNKSLSIENLKSKERMTLSDVSFIKAHKGNALCETIVLCYLAEKSFVFDPYLTNVLVEKRILQETDLTNLLKEKKFSLIQLESLSYYHSDILIQGEERFSNDFLSKLKTYYYIKYKSELGVYLVPK